MTIKETSEKLIESLQKCAEALKAWSYAVATLDFEFRLVEEWCPKCGEQMYTLHFPKDGWFMYIAGTLPRCIECEE
jgi:transposase-like protein